MTFEIENEKAKIIYYLFTYKLTYLILFSNYWQEHNNLKNYFTSRLVRKKRENLRLILWSESAGDACRHDIAVHSISTRAPKGKPPGA